MVYDAISPSPEYEQLMGEVFVGNMEVVYEQYLPHGQKYIAVAPITQNNPPKKTIERMMPWSARRGAVILREYVGWQDAWWRESIQNAVDAGATHIQCALSMNKDKTWTITIIDNGTGMDETILLDKFLTSGGSGKEGTGQGIGGFGAAKELLLLPWLHWHLHSQDLVAEGVGPQQKIGPASSYLKGTKLEVIMPADTYTQVGNLLSVILRSNLPGVKFTVITKDDTDTYRAKLDPKTRMAEYGVPGLVEFLFEPTPGQASRSIYVRHKLAAENIRQARERAGNTATITEDGSLYMFTTYVAEDIPGNLIADILAPSLEVYTANRDKFVNYKAEWAITKIAGRIAVDTMSVFRRASGVFTKKYAGDPALIYRAEAASAEVLQHINSATTNYSGLDRQESRQEARDNIESVISQIRESDQQLALTKNEPNIVSVATPQSIDILLDSIEAMVAKGFEGQPTLETAAKQLLWKPPFIVVNEEPNFTPPAEFFPESMSSRAMRLAKIWAELCRHVLVHLNCQRGFGIGFVFGSKIQALCMEEDEQGEYPGVSAWLMVNPFRLYKSIEVDWSSEDGKKGSMKGDIWKPSKMSHLEWLFVRAVHECTHMVDRIWQHNEDFTSAFGHNTTRCMRIVKHIRKIAADIKQKDMGGLKSIDAKAARRAILETGAQHPFTPGRGKPPKDPSQRKCAICKIPAGYHD